LVSEELAVIAEGSLLNKVFPSKKEYCNQLRLGLQSWTKRNGLPSMPISEISDLSQKLWTAHVQQVTCHITKFLHQLINFKKNPRGYYLPARGQTILVTSHILPVLVLPSH
jgi:hypothetical protein